jgi:hypothetical protein
MTGIQPRQGRNLCRKCSNKFLSSSGATYESHVDIGIQKISQCIRPP